MKTKSWQDQLADLLATYTQEDVALLIECSQSTISRLASGETTDPSYSLVERIRAAHDDLGQLDIYL